MQDISLSEVSRALKISADMSKALPDRVYTNAFRFVGAPVWQRCFDSIWSGTILYIEVNPENETDRLDFSA